MNTISDKFCYLPFGSIYVAPNGALSPCCVASPFKENINFKDFNSVDEAINSEPYKRIRKEMLNNVAPTECAECFVYKNRHKEHSNMEFRNQISEPTLYNEDYTVNKIVYTDLRLSNHCNFRCRMCYHGSSSMWYDYWGYVQNQPHYNNENTRYLTAGENSLEKFSDENIDTIRKIYLAGGEPFITPTTFTLLDKFSDEQAKNVYVLINTNLSTLTYKGIDILEKLKRFKTVDIACSCDGYGKIGEYQRPGFNSDRFFKNLETVVKFKEKHKNFIVAIDYTISTINMYHTFDFIDFVSKNYLHPDSIRFHTVTQPFYFAPGICRGQMKEDLIKLYNENIDKLDSICKYTLMEFVKYLKTTDDENVYKHLLDKKKWLTISLPETLRRFDEVNQTDYKEICPWLGEIFVDNYNNI
jgi:organic radical activating enzyme